MWKFSDHGYLIVKTYSRLYHDYVDRYFLNPDIYALPSKGKKPSEMPIQYHGMNRDALTDFDASDNLAEIYLAELKKDGKGVDGFIFSEPDVRLTFSFISEPMDYEVIWARIYQLSSLPPPSQPHDVFRHGLWLGFFVDSIGLEPSYFEEDRFPVTPQPPGFVSIGFEPSYFDGDHFSASCDCMLIPRWHGTDKEGKLFQLHFAKLNNHGLFESADDAAEFLSYYLSFDWTETGDYVIAEVFIQSGDPNP